MKRLLLSTIVCLCGCLYGRAQGNSPNALNMGGGFLNNGYYQYEFSVGEMAAIETMISPAHIITNGVLQPLTNLPFGNNTSSSWSNDEIKIFPVPTRGRIEIDILSKQQGNVRIQLVNGSGQALRSEQFDYAGLGRIVIWDLSNLASADYYLRIVLDPKPGSVNKSGSFKIIKIN